MGEIQRWKDWVVDNVVAYSPRLLFISDMIHTYTGEDQIWRFYAELQQQVKTRVHEVVDDQAHLVIYIMTCPTEHH